MNYARSASVLFFLLSSAILSAGAQDFDAVGFDPTPVRIPSLEKSKRRPVSSMDLLEIRDEKGVSISPDGKYVAFVAGQAVYETNGYQSGLYVVGTAPGSAPVCLGTAGAPRWDPINQWLSESPQWSRDSKYITRLAKMDKAASWQVWRWGLNGDHPRQITNVPGNVQSYRWTLDGDKIVVTFEKPRDPAENQRLSEDGILYDGGLDAGHGRPVVSEVLAAKPHEIETWIHDVTTGEERKQTKAEANSIGRWVSDIGEEYNDRTGASTFVGHHLLDAKVSPDGHRVAYRIIDDSPGTKVVYELFSKPVVGGTPVNVAPGVYFVGDYWWAIDSSGIYFTQNLGDGHPNKLMVVPAGGGTPRQVFSSSDALYDCSPDRSFRYMACAGENRAAPSQVALVDIATGTGRTLVDLNPEFANLELGSITRLDGVNRYGDSWWAELVKPLNYEPGKKYPLIVTTYRTREFPRGASGDENPIHVYAAHGFAVLSFDYGIREFDNKPGDFQRYLSWYESVDASIEMAIDAAAKMGVADTTRVGLAGYSRGTEIVSYAITHTKLFRAVSGAAGDDSPYYYYMARRHVQDDVFSRDGEGGWPEGKSKANWRQRAPELNADRIDAPVLNNDPDSEFLQDLALYTSLRDLGRPMELFIYPDELHHLNQPKHRYQIYERNLDWFRFWLKSEESADPAKSGQYQRWRQLRQLQEKAQSNEKDTRESQN
ncbi:MAG: Atxe2 family lasso peptide isopeptidase [Halobacteriota archaeon]|jgi:dipeptidyl aminopeptidase/acylaminoacyl peptidase